MTMINRLLPIFLLFGSAIDALDIVFKGIECNHSLPIYVADNDFALTCDGSDRCTMGTDVVLSGKRKFDE